MREINDLNRERPMRFLGSVITIGFGLIGIVASCKTRDLSPVFPLIIFVAFLATSAFIISTIAARLYAQHELQRFRFDMTNLFLTTTLLSLPFGTASIFWRLIEQHIGDEFRVDETGITLAITGALFFLLFPVLFIAEASLSWYRILRNRDKN